MDGVQKACNSASTEKSEQKQIMVHHSRDTEEKQWQVNICMKKYEIL